MRLSFRTLTRPKHLAERIQTVFPALGHMEAQQWSARMLGYRDWHELTQSIGPHVTETPDIPGSADDETFIEDETARSELHTRQWYQREVLEKLAGIPLPGLASLFQYIDPNFPNARYKKLGVTGSGSASLKGLAWDLYGREGELPATGVGGMGWPADGEENSYAYYGVPEGVTEEEFIDKLLRYMERRRLPYKEFTDVARECLTTGPFAKSELVVDEIESISGGTAQFAMQCRRHRYFLIEKGQPTGFAVIETRARADSDDEELHFDIEVCEAWWAKARNEGIFDAMTFTIETEIEAALRRLLWFRACNPTARVHVGIETESECELAWRVAEALPGLIRGHFEGYEPQGALDDVSFDVDISP